MFVRRGATDHRRSWTVSRAAARAVGLDDASTDQRILDELRRWVTSLPWVRERTGPAGSTIRRFTVDCPPLARASTWLLIGSFDDLDEWEPEIHLVLPGPIADLGVTNGWAVLEARMPGNHAVVAVQNPTNPAELRALEALVLIAYSTAFPAPVREPSP
jgi:hypothetical protein